MTAFQIWILIYNSATMLLSTKYVLTTIKSLQMRYCMTFHLKGHQVRIERSKKDLFYQVNLKVKSMTSVISIAP